MRFLIIVWFLVSCHPNKNKLIDLNDLKFKTTDASEIFFKNIRKSYYEIEEIPESGIEMYRLKSDKELSTPLKPFIVYNWRQDFASIMFETQGINSESITLIFEKNEKQHKQIFGISFPKVQSYLAIRIYNALLDNEKIFIIIDNQKKEILRTENQREDFRITVFDFLRLVEMR